ncbi:MAG: MDR family MFS transporter [Oenococcus sp.]|uniref:MDR family MFS transporter n=1 Tax=Oenococcus sp. TaxID=1979414 RepID=UPI0039EA1128
MQKRENTISKSTMVTAWILVLGAIAPLLDSTMVNIAIHSLVKNLNSSISTIQWTITGYVLATGIAVPFSSWLLNKFDGKFVFVSGEILFVLGSILSALAGNAQFLIGARLVQGFAGGIIMPLLTTLLVQTAGQKVMGQMMATVGLPIILGPLAGPVIGGVIIRYLSWQWIFWVNVPVALIAIILILLKMPNYPAQNKSAKMDFVGIFFIAAATTSIIYAIVRAARDASFLNQSTLWFMGLGLILLLLYLAWAFRLKEKAVLPLSLFKYRSFNGSVLGLLIAGTVLNGAMLVLPLFFQNIRGMSVMAAGLALIPQGIGMLASRTLTGRLTDKIGAKYVVLASLVITFAGTIPFYWIDGQTPYWLIAFVLLIRGIGAGGILMPLMADSYTGMEGRLIPAASIGSRTIQNIGSAFGSAIVTTLMTAYSHTQIKQFKVNLANGHFQMKPLKMHEFILQHLDLIQTHSFQYAFLCIAIAALLIALPCILLTNRMKSDK